MIFLNKEIFTQLMKQKVLAEPEECEAFFEFFASRYAYIGMKKILKTVEEDFKRYSTPLQLLDDFPELRSDFRSWAFIEGIYDDPYRGTDMQFNDLTERNNEAINALRLCSLDVLARLKNWLIDEGFLNRVIRPNMYIVSPVDSPTLWLGGMP
jgi:hypothetical protein